MMRRLEFPMVVMITICGSFILLVGLAALNIDRIVTGLLILLVARYQFLDYYRDRRDRAYLHYRILTSGYVRESAGGGYEAVSADGLVCHLPCMCERHGGRK